ncbi:MAG: hypothetical protein U0837_05725 [Dehalococcoidia bacterium]
MHAVALFASFGILGLAVACLIRRKRWSGWAVHACDGVVWVLFAALLAGSAARVFEDARGVTACEPPPEIQNYAWEQGRQVAVDVTPFETVMTWPVSGLLIAYADVSGANLCYFPVQEFYLARFAHWPLPRRAIFVGNVLMARELDVYDIDGGLKLSSHEVRHREQWAWSTLIGGPFAFPTAYTIDDFFFPGSMNHFERAAGLKGGGYEEESSPRLRVTEVALFGLMAVAAGVAAINLRSRQQRN